MVGMITGALTQSTNAVTVILMSLFKADLITVPQARPVLVWANVGTMVLVFAAAVDTHLFVLLIISAAGLCFYLDLDRSARWRPTVAALFAFALLFLGLELMRQGSQEIRSSFSRGDSRASRQLRACSIERRGPPRRWRVSGPAWPTAAPGRPGCKSRGSGRAPA